MQFRLLASLALLTALASPSSAQIYRWVDADGTVNFGDSPPSSAATTELDLPAGPTAAQSAAAQERLDQQLEMRARQQTAASEAGAAQGQVVAEPLSLSCYLPLTTVLQGTTRQAYDGINPASLQPEMRNKITRLLADTSHSWSGTVSDTSCSGSDQQPEAVHDRYSATTTGTWDRERSRLRLETRLRGGRARADETISHYLEVSDKLYYFDANGEGMNDVTRTIAMSGNEVLGFALAKDRLAFGINRRNIAIVRTELREIHVTDRKLHLTELFFHNNILTGVRDYRLSR